MSATIEILNDGEHVWMNAIYRTNEITTAKNLRASLVFIDEVISEIFRANSIHGTQIEVPDCIWALIAAEESGEAVKATLQGKCNEELFTEVIQAAAMFIQWGTKIILKGEDNWRDIIPVSAS